MLTLWGRPTSSNVKKILWILDEIALDFEHIKVGGTYGGLDDQEYLALNPSGLIPTLKDDDLVIWESNTIVRYIAARYGKGIFWIADCGKRAQAEKWMDWTMTALVEPFKQILFNSVRLKPEDRSLDTLQKAIVDFEHGLKIMEGELGKASYLSGSHFGIGDLVVGVFAYYYFAIDIKRNATFPKVEAWYKCLQERPAYCRQVMTPIS